jgi:uncharacterized protein (DUF2235 family)
MEIFSLLPANIDFTTTASRLFSNKSKWRKMFQFGFSNTALCAKMLLTFFFRMLGIVNKDHQKCRRPSRFTMIIWTTSLTRTKRYQINSSRAEMKKLQRRKYLQKLIAISLFPCYSSFCLIKRNSLKKTQVASYSIF